MAILSEQDFHDAIHTSIGTPVPGYKTTNHPKRTIRKKYDKTHTTDWATSRINLKSKQIHIGVYIDFQQNSLSTSDYQMLKQLAAKGIERYWSRTIKLKNDLFNVMVQVHHRRSHSIDVDLYIVDDKDYGRSHNSGIIDASFKYNKGAFGKATHTIPAGKKMLVADMDFMLVSAHEFGHSVLEFFGGVDFSWGHKGSTTVVTQKAKKTTPGYPVMGNIDLLKYYNGSLPVSVLYRRSKIEEVDVKRLVWLSKVTIK